MSNSTILMAEFLKTKRTATRRIAIASPLCLALMVIVQQGYFSLNLFNWYYVVFLPATFALISASAVNIDNGKTDFVQSVVYQFLKEKYGALNFWLY